MCTRGLFTQVGLGPGAFWASAGPKCAVGSNTGRVHAVIKGRGLQTCRGLEVVAFAARSRGFFQLLEAGAFLPPYAVLFMLPELVAFFTARSTIAQRGLERRFRRGRDWCLYFRGPNMHIYLMALRLGFGNFNYLLPIVFAHPTLNKAIGGK